MRRKRPARFDSWLIRAAVAVLLAGAVILILMNLPPEATSLPPDASAPLEVYFLDMGQADSILIMQGDSACLIDSGTNRKAEDLTETLRSLGVDRLDVVVGTHPHEDHIGGLDAVIHAFPINTLIMPKIEHTTQTFFDVMDAAENAGLRITTPKAGARYNVGAAELEVLYDELDEDSLNNCSVVTRLTYAGRSLLLMGDAETLVEEKLLASGASLKSDFLKVGHHGSSTSSSIAFLDAVDPLEAFILCGVDNSYNHPHAITLRKLEELSESKDHPVGVYRSDRHGTILLRVETEGKYTIDVWEG